MKQNLQGLFPGDQLTTLLQMLGVFAITILYGAVRAKFWQDRGGSAVFLTKQRFQTLFGKQKTETTTAINKEAKSSRNPDSPLMS